MSSRCLPPVTTVCLFIIVLLVSQRCDSLSKVTPIDDTAPVYHFRPAKNWINGPFYYNGWYHLFYQYNPNGAVWNNTVWAHSVSSDLINWIAVEPAMTPNIPSDVYGCWSGSVTILHDGTPVIMYTGINHPHVNYQVQNIAFPKNLSDPHLREWVKPDYNPIIIPEPGDNVTQFRDPTTAWYIDGYWRLLIGGVQGYQGLAFVYRSRDFKVWTRSKHPLHSALTGMWECPDFYPVAEYGLNGLERFESDDLVKYVLKNSLDVNRYDYYTIGTYDKMTDRYVPDNHDGDYHHLRYDYGNFYASKTFYDPVKQRRVLWGWANESDSTKDDMVKGWAGIQAIPRKIWLDPSGKQIMQWPVEEIKKLRGEPITIGRKILKPVDHIEVTGLSAGQADVEVAFKISTSSLEKAEPFDLAFTNDAEQLCGLKHANVKGGVGPFGLWVLASPNLEEKTAVFFRVFRAVDNRCMVLMCTDPTMSSLKPDIYKPTFAGFVDTNITQRGAITLRTLIDGSVIESFGDGGKTCILSRVYPTLAVGENARLLLFNNGAVDITVSKLTAWGMKKPLMNDV
ncbi:hypothetical protein ACP70R_026892 [Stipagrostis hirtigluma subsp. patula]